MTNQHMFNLRLWCRKRKFTRSLPLQKLSVQGYCIDNSIFPDKTTTELPTGMHNLQLGP